MKTPKKHCVETVEIDGIIYVIYVLPNCPGKSLQVEELPPVVHSTSMVPFSSLDSLFTEAIPGTTIYAGFSPDDELLSGMSHSNDLIGLVSIDDAYFEQLSQQWQSEDIEGQDDYIYGLASIPGNTDLYSSIESASDLIALSDDIAIVDLNVYSDSL